MALVDGFSHLVIHVTDLDRSEKFYREIFGLDLMGRDLVSDEGPNSLLSMNTRQRVLLVQMSEVVPFRPNSSSIHHAWHLTIEQFERAKERLAARGFNITDSRQAFRAMGEHSLDVFDPDGHRFQIQAYGPEAKQIIVENVGEIDCGNVGEYELGTVKVFAKGRFSVVRLEEGFVALSRWCTHMNGVLAWKPEHWQFYCPMHGAIYNRRGECTQVGRELPPLRLHPLSIAPDGAITVRPDEVIRRETVRPSDAVPAPDRHSATAHA